MAKILKSIGNFNTKFLLLFNIFLKDTNKFRNFLWLKSLCFEWCKPDSEYSDECNLEGKMYYFIYTMRF